MWQNFRKIGTRREYYNAPMFLPVTRSEMKRLMGHKMRWSWLSDSRSRRMEARSRQVISVDMDRLICWLVCGDKMVRSTRNILAKHVLKADAKKPTIEATSPG